jgi:hypothetical protein
MATRTAQIVTGEAADNIGGDEPQMILKGGNFSPGNGKVNGVCFKIVVGKLRRRTSIRIPNISGSLVQILDRDIDTINDTLEVAQLPFVVHRRYILSTVKVQLLVLWRQHCGKFS